MKHFYAGITDPGLVRSVNQDAYYIDPIGRFFMVADGMGGHAGGQVAILYRQGQFWCAHVGDSRLYRLRGAKLDRLTQDHTWIAQAVKAGALTSDQARMHPMRHVLAQCLGREEGSEIEIQQVEGRGGDRFMLCSDGLTEELTDPLIANHLKSIRSCDMAASSLVNSAKQHGGRDNITVVIVAIDPNSR